MGGASGIRSFDAELTDKGRQFVQTWKSQSDDLLSVL